MSTEEPTPWVCAQLGSREHYAIPRMLHRSGRLKLLLTDYWSPPKGRLAVQAPGREAAKAAQRFHPDLVEAPVLHLGVRRLVFELLARVARRSGWTTIIKRNRLFQNVALRQLRRSWQTRLGESPGVFFAYSYAALDLLAFFRGLGWKTVLGQIDPGLHEENIVAAELAKHADISTSWARAPSEYWTRWSDECALADRIMVNSAWSRQALVATGIAAEKIEIVPLAFENPGSNPAKRDETERFSDDRPLRILFLGQLNIRKGVHLAFEAAQILRDAPVEWRFVGPAEINLPPDLAGSSRVRWTGPVSRAATANLYQQADLFLLPTLSDGFALTQLEAQAAGLPLLASRNCGEVVDDGVNGWFIDPLDAPTIAALIRRALDHPGTLREMSAQSRVAERFSMPALLDNLIRLEAGLGFGVPPGPPEIN